MSEKQKFIPRLLWAYEHHVGRYQEVNLFMDAGFEVILSLGNVETEDINYHNETHHLYPAWRSSCSLATNLVEQIRSVPIHETPIQPAQNFIDLFNEHVDVILLNVSGPHIASIMSWFSGILIYRINGYYDDAAEQEKLQYLENFLSLNPEVSDRFFYCAGLINLLPEQYPTLRKNAYVVNSWVAPERLPYHWSKSQSNQEIVSAISYNKQYEYFRQQAEKIKKNITALPLAIIGKNKKEDIFTGVLPDQEFYCKLADARLYVEVGECPTHLIFPPLEAMHMGVPVLFQENNALVYEALSNGYTKEELADAGMFPSFEAINNFIKLNYNQFDKLEKIARNQNRIFIANIFSYKLALSRAVNLYEKLAHKVSILKKVETRSISLFHQKKEQKSTNIISYIKGLGSPSLCNTNQLIQPHLLHTLNGKMHFDKELGQFILEASMGDFRAGNLFEEELPDFLLDKDSMEVVFAPDRKLENIRPTYLNLKYSIKQSILQTLSIIKQLLRTVFTETLKIILGSIRILYYKFSGFRWFMNYSYAQFIERSQAIATVKLIVIDEGNEFEIYSQPAELDNNDNVTNIKIPLEVLQLYKHKRKKIILYWSGRGKIKFSGIRFNK